MNTDKAIVIIGPTASGKSDLAIKLAQEKNGEIISVDSRQIYRGMDIGTGKVTKTEQALVPHHLLDICDPLQEFNVSAFLKKARAIEKEIRARGKLPIFCGGTLFWIEAYLKKSDFPPVPPNPKLRAVLDQKSAQELFAELQKKDSKRAQTIDQNNKVRLIRALEIIEKLGHVPALPLEKDFSNEYEIIILEPEKEMLRDRIKKRLTARFNEGMVAEVEKLLARGVSHEWLQSIGLEYKYISLYLQKKLSQTELEEQLFHAIWHYAKRQITFLKRFKTQKPLGSLD